MIRKVGTLVHGAAKGFKVKVSKLARDVFSNNLTETEKALLNNLWSTSPYRLTLAQGLAMRDAFLTKTVPAVPEHLADMLKVNRWADSNLPILLFPTSVSGT